MQAIRAVKKVSGNKITIDLPDSFYAKEVEVIIIPYKKVTSVDEGDDWKNDFLSVSQWEISEHEIRMKSWPIEEY
ncbi:MAG: hypothetical protein R6U68_09505 [Desulfobacteraceae bacterium]